MTTVRAVYQGGLLRPLQPIDLAEGETVDVTVTPPREAAAPPISDEEFLRRIKECNSYHDWFELTKLLPPDDSGYDIVKALDANRRWSGERPLLPNEVQSP